MTIKGLDKQSLLFGKEQRKDICLSNPRPENFLWQMGEVRIIKLVEKIIVFSGLITLLGMAYYQWIEDLANYNSVFYYGGFVCGHNPITTNDLGYFVVFWVCFIGFLMFLGNAKK